MPPVAVQHDADYVGTVRGRIGYAFGTWLPYVTGGLAWGHTHGISSMTAAAGDSSGHYQPGWTAGTGVEFAVSGNWSAKVEYDYVDAVAPNVRFERLRRCPTSMSILAINVVKLGLNYRFGDDSPTCRISGRRRQSALRNRTQWNVHAQTTFLRQPAIRAIPRALCRPQQSSRRRTAADNLDVDGLSRACGYGRAAKFYFDPELAQGFGSNGTLGTAGFPNGEAQKAGAAYPKIRPQRYYLRQTFGLGGEQEDVADGPNQLPKANATSIASP